VPSAANQLSTDIGNVRITGGSPNMVLQTSGNGNLSWGYYNWSTLTGKPVFSAVAVSGNYNDLLNKPAIPNFSSYATLNYVDAKIANIGSNINFNSLSVSGTITSANANLGNVTRSSYFVGNGAYLTGVTVTAIANGSSNISIPVSNGNVLVNVSNNNILTVAAGGMLVQGNLSVPNNVLAGNLIAGTITASSVRTDNLLRSNGSPYTFDVGNISASVGGTNTQIQFNDSGSFNGNSSFTFNKVNGKVSATIFAGSGSELANISAANVIGNFSNITVNGAIIAGAGTGGNISGANTITANNVVFTGNILSGNTVRISTSNVSLGDISNIKVTGGSSNYFLRTDGTGNLSWAPASASSINTTTKEATGYNVARLTVASMNNISARVYSNGMPQISAVSGNSVVCISTVSVIGKGASLPLSTIGNTTGIIAGVWTNAGNAMSNFGDYVTAHVQDTSSSTVHRITFLQTANLSNASVIIERLV